MSKINVQNIEIGYQVVDDQDYICLTDMAKQKDGRIEIIIQNWMRNRMTIEFLGLWEKINNPNFNHIEFDVFRSKAGLNSFYLTPTQWMEKTNANGPGVRVSLFVSGCTHYCKDCFNSEAWDFNYGIPFTEETMEELLKAIDREWIEGITFLGGEPMNPRNVEKVSEIIQRIRCSYPEKNIWVYSGYTLAELLERAQDNNPSIQDRDSIRSVLRNIDVLVDGRFVTEKKDLKLRFRGSSNQHIIDIPHFFKTKEIREPDMPT